MKIVKDILTWKDGNDYIKQYDKTDARFYRIVNVEYNITIEPGTKKSNHDFIVLIDGQQPTYIDICELIFDITTINNANKFAEFLDDFLVNALQAKESDVITDRAKHFLYWLLLQEDINYPPPKLGRVLSCKRLYEAVIAKICPQITNLKEITNRIYAGIPPTSYEIPFPISLSTPNFY